jgi:alpha-methylacyl-CoA racemase
VKPLTGLKILDITQRLPGPMAAMLLSDLGAEVTKLEDSNRRDAFLQTNLEPHDDQFSDWYREINQTKLLVLRDLKKESIQDLIEQADIILISQPLPSLPDLLKVSSSIVILEVSSHKPMHDLNALAETGALANHLSAFTQSPAPGPFLPVAGVAFAQQIALTALALYRQAQLEKKPVISKVFLDTEVARVFSPLRSEKLKKEKRTKFLHNGLYPCYACYQNKDGKWLAVACVEEKFWKEFVRLFDLNLNPSDRFNTDSTIFQHIAQSIQSRSTTEIEQLLNNKEICVSMAQA